MKRRTPKRAIMAGTKEAADTRSDEEDGRAPSRQGQVEASVVDQVLREYPEAVEAGPGADAHDDEHRGDHEDLQPPERHIAVAERRSGPQPGP
jgi:hypothetical protein